MVPTIGGLLLFGRERLSRFPDAFIQAGRFAGTDLQQKAAGTLVDMHAALDRQQRARSALHFVDNGAVETVRLIESVRQEI